MYLPNRPLVQSSEKERIGPTPYLGGLTNRLVWGTFVAGIIWQGDQFFIQKRYSSGMLGGLWEFPGGKVESGESLVVALKQKIKEKCGTETKIIKQVGSINHAY